MRENIIPANGLWFKQINSENQGNIIIMVRKAFKNSQNLYNSSLWFFDKNQIFYKRIDAKKMILQNNQWVIQEAVLNDKNNFNESHKLITQLTKKLKN